MESGDGAAARELRSENLRARPLDAAPGKEERVREGCVGKALIVSPYAKINNDRRAQRYVSSWALSLRQKSRTRIVSVSNLAVQLFPRCEIRADHFGARPPRRAALAAQPALRCAVNCHDAASAEPAAAT